MVLEPRLIGVLGGTFDPIHFGHLRPALEILQALELDEIRFVPCRIPAHRATPSITAEQRLALVRLATAGQPGFVADDRELRRAGPSYMVDTLTSLRAEVGDAPLCLILGTDAFRELLSWRRWRESPKPRSATRPAPRRSPAGACVARRSRRPSVTPDSSPVEAV